MALLLIKLPVQVIPTQEEAEGATLDGVEGATQADPLMGSDIVRNPHVFMLNMFKLDYLMSCSKKLFQTDE